MFVQIKSSVRTQLETLLDFKKNWLGDVFIKKNCMWVIFSPYNKLLTDATMKLVKVITDHFSMFLK